MLASISQSVNGALVGALRGHLILVLQVLKPAQLTCSVFELSVLVVSQLANAGVSRMGLNLYPAAVLMAHHKIEVGLLGFLVGLGGRRSV